MFSKVSTLFTQYANEHAIPIKILNILKGFYESYVDTVGLNQEVEAFFLLFLEEVKKQCKEPYLFEPYHERITHPFNYYEFGLAFLRPLVDKPSSKLLGEENLAEITEHLKKNHNVIFFANHQTEADPQVISLLLGDKYSEIAEEMIAVAGERVTTDPLAVPFSKGRNLLCIYSKRHIDHPPEQKQAKQFHNQKTMSLMSDLLKKGGKCIYVAPSGGRDRRGASGQVEIAPFDPQSVEMFYLMAKKSKTPTFFYPMALATYDLLPPPETIQIELGEKRLIQRVPIHLAIGKQIDMEDKIFLAHNDKHIRRKYRADYIWELVKNDYAKLL